MPLSNYLQKKLLDHVLGVAAYTEPTQWWASAHTASPNGTQANESAMARVQLTWPGGASGVPALNNPSGDVTFTNNSGSTITVTHVQINDASTAGNGLIYGTLSPSKSVPDGAELIITADDFDVTMV